MVANLNKILYFFYTVSRGYSLPTSLTSWLLAFVYCLKHGGNIIYGLIALVGITFAHLGANLLDDCVDTIKKVPKQKCKTEYLDKNIFSFKSIILACTIYLGIATLTGFYLFLKCGWLVFIIAFVTAIIILLYPRLNHFSLGEAAVGITYGLLLFSGMSVVMLGSIEPNMILISIPVSLLVLNLLFAHSIMDFEFDSKNDKKTLCVKLGSQERGLKLFILIGLLTFFSHIILVQKSVMSLLSLLGIIPIVIYYWLAYKKLKNYIKNKDDGSFMQIFKLVRNASFFYNVLLALVILC